MKKIAEYALIGALIQLVCSFFYFLVNIMPADEISIPASIFTGVQALQMVGKGMICYFFTLFGRGKANKILIG